MGWLGERGLLKLDFSSSLKRKLKIVKKVMVEVVSREEPPLHSPAEIAK